MFQGGVSVGHAVEGAPGVFTFTSASLADDSYTFTYVGNTQETFERSLAVALENVKRLKSGASLLNRVA